jgi:hypothetical protein
MNRAIGHPLRILGPEAPVDQVCEKHLVRSIGQQAGDPFLTILFLRRHQLLGPPVPGPGQRHSFMNQPVIGRRAHPISSPSKRDSDQGSLIPD